MLLKTPPRSKTKREIQSVDISAVCFMMERYFRPIREKTREAYDFFMKAQQLQRCVFNFLSKPRRSVKPENSHGTKCRAYGPWKDGPWSLSFSLRPFCRAPPKLRTASSSFKLALSLSLSLSLSQRHQTLTLFSKPQKPQVMGARVFIFFQFCDVATLAIILKRN